MRVRRYGFLDDAIERMKPAAQRLRQSGFGRMLLIVRKTKGLLQESFEQVSN